MRIPITSLILDSWLCWLIAIAKPMRQPHTISRGSKRLPTSSVSHPHRGRPSHTNHLPQQEAIIPSSSDHPIVNTASPFIAAPDAGKGKRLLGPPSLIYDSRAGHLVAESHIPANRRLVQAHPFEISKARRIDRPLEQSWKDDFPGQVMAMGETISRYTGKSLTTCHRLLSKYGNHEIAHGLASGNEELQLQAIAKLPFTKGRFRTESVRTLYLGDQAEEITEKYRKMYKLTRKQATDKLRHSLTPSVARLMRNPATFAEGARKLRFSALLSRTKVGKRSRASPAISTHPKETIHNAAEKSPIPQHPVSASNPNMLPGLQQVQHQPSHFAPFVDYAGPLGQTPSQAKDQDDIDFDAVMEWVNRDQHKGGPT